MPASWLGKALRLLAALGAALALADAALAQTAIINAITGQSCAGTRAARNLGCTANDFAVGLQFTQPAATAIANCTAGEYINIDVIATLSSGSPNRYAAGIFIGESGNSPQLNNAANTCSVGMFPTSPSPFNNADGDVCGDFFGSSNATLQVSGVRVLCTPQPGSNNVLIPYVVAWDNQTSGTCTAASITASTNSKCVAESAAGVTGVAVRGYVVITKATNPTYSTQTFSFSAAASPTVAVSTSSFALSNGQSLTVQVPLSDTGGVRALTISEALVGGWESNASITCTAPGGGSAGSYVTINNASRSITANLSGANYAALCTITNNKQTRVRTTKVAGPAGDTGRFDLSAQTPLGTTTTTNTGTGGATAYQQSTAGAAVTVTETATAGTSMTHYVSSVACTNQDNGQTVSFTTTSLSGSTRQATFTPAPYVDTSCTFTNVRTANVSVTKSNGTSTVAAGATTTYALVVSNAGPAPANGAVLRDPATTGLACSSISCSGTTGGAACPATLDIPTLQGAGLTLASLPPNSSVTLSLTCLVTASGS